MTDRLDCTSLTQSMGVLGKPWTLLIVNEALVGATRYVDFLALGIAPDILVARLAMLVKHGLMRREAYHVDGQRAREAYRLTDAGRELLPSLAALQQWSDAHMPVPSSPMTERRAINTNRSVRVAFIDDRGREVPIDEIVTVRHIAEHNSSKPSECVADWPI